MKFYLILTCVVCLILLLFPLGCVTIKNTYNKNTDSPSSAVYQSSDKKAETVSVFVVSDNKTDNMSVTDYLIGAVAAEMPASFHAEALKAQAIACYSYMLWLKTNADNPDYDITSDPERHQGYLTSEEMKTKWGDKYENYHKKISEAVAAVKGEYITYKGEVILALFHGISPGTTQSSEDVWASPLPYIKSKIAPGDNLSPDFDTVVTVPCRNIRESFTIDSSVKDSELIDIFTLSDSSYIKNIPLGKSTASAGDLASELYLPSPYFTAEYKEGSYIFKVKGKGHGLGMSQYSADYMARQGSSYGEILAHFYEGTELRKN